MIHPDLDHPVKVMSQQVLVSILTEQGPEPKVVKLQQIQWNSMDENADTVLISSGDTDGNEPEVAVYSTMTFVSKRAPSASLALDSSK